MELIDKTMALWGKACEKAAPTVKKLKHFWVEFKKKYDVVWNTVKRMHKVVLAIPVGFFAVCIAVYNLAKLPALVGIFLQENGDYLLRVPRELSVLGPLALTAICLLLMFISKRILTPWLVSVFTLIVPFVILLTNTFPA